MDLLTIALTILGIMGVLGSVLGFGYGLFNMGRSFWSLFDHTRVPKDTMLLPGAKITNVHSEKVKYVKNGTKYKTTVTFSDGFKFITHKTNREDNVFTYQISVDTDEILENAIKAHDRALKKQK